MFPLRSLIIYIILPSITDVVVFLGSNSSVESDHASSSAKSAPVQDNILDEQTDGPEMKIQKDYAPSSKNYFELTGRDENGTSLRAEEIDHGESQYSSILSSGSSVEEDSEIRLSSKSVENVVLVEESPKSPIPSDVMFVSKSNGSSSDLLANSDKTVPATSNSILQAFCEVDGFQLMSGGSQSASSYSNPSPKTWDTQGISHMMARPGNEPADEDGQLREVCATSGEERVVKSHDFCDGAAMVVPYSTKIITECTKTDSSVSSDSSLARTQNVANGGSLSSTQQHVFSDGEGEITPPSSGVIDWKRLGARPKKPQRTVDGQVPKEPVVYITDGLAGDFLVRHTQDKSLHDSIYQTDGASLFNDIPSQGTSFIDSDISQFSRAQPYFGDCQAVSRTEPHGKTGHSLVSGSSRHLGGSSYVEPFSDNSGLWPSHLGNDSSSLYSNYLSRNTSTAANNYSLQSDFVHNSSRFAGVDHFDRQTYLPSAKQTPFPPIASDPDLNSYSGMAGSSFADPSWTDAALTLPGDPVHNAPRFSSFLSEQLTAPAHETPGQAVGRSSELRAREGIKKEEREMKEAGSWLQQGETTYSQQLHGNYDNQSSSSSSSAQTHKITVDDTGARDWESAGAKPKQVSEEGLLEVEQIPSEPPVPQFGASSVDSSHNSSLSQEKHVERTSSEREQRYSLTTSRTQGSIAGNIPWSQQDAITDAGRSLAATDRERNGLTDEFLARHTQDMSLRGSLNQRIASSVSLPPDISSQGTSCHGGGNITRGAPIRDYVPDSLDITGRSLTWVPHQRDTSQQHSRRVSETWPISLELVILYLLNVP